MAKSFSLFFAALLLFASCSSPFISSPLDNITAIHIGYCPTMSEDLNILSAIDENLEFIRLPSAAHAIQSLLTGEVDAILIGRKPHTHELSADMVALQLEEGYTLISAQQQFIPYPDLEKIPIHSTHLPETALSILPSDTKIILHENLDQAIEAGLNSAILINWEQVESWHQLLIPINERGEKIRTFRTPFFVYLQSNFDHVLNLLDNLPVDFMKNENFG